MPSRRVAPSTRVVSRQLGRGPLRALRTAAVALPTLQLALAAHLLVDGCVEVVAAALAATLCLAGAWVVTARETSTGLLLAYLASAQVAVHGLLACAGSGAVVTTESVGLHALAAGGAALLLRRADAALWAGQRLRVLLAAYRFVLLALPRPVSPPPVAPVTGLPRVRLRDAGPRSVPVRRGPPLLLLRAS